MIKFNFCLSNPFGNNSYNTIFLKNGNITKNKFWEIEFHRNQRTLFSIGFTLTFKQSHSGLSFDFGLFGYWFMLEIYDNRHWNYDNNCWEETE